MTVRYWDDSYWLANTEADQGQLGYACCQYIPRANLIVRNKSHVLLTLDDRFDHTCGSFYDIVFLLRCYHCHPFRISTKHILITWIIELTQSMSQWHMWWKWLKMYLNDTGSRIGPIHISTTYTYESTQNIIWWHTRLQRCTGSNRPKVHLNDTCGIINPNRISMTCMTKSARLASQWWT